MTKKTIQLKEVGYMCKNELLDILNSELKAKCVQTVEQLFTSLKKNKTFDSSTSKKAYVEFLRDELAYQVLDRPKLVSPTDVGNYISAKYSELKKEEFILLSYDNSNRIISEDIVSIGTLDKAIVEPRDVFNVALANNAANIICCHNHPSGQLYPSDADFNITKRLSKAGNVLGVGLLDHFIIGNGRYLSMKENELL